MNSLEEQQRKALAAYKAAKAQYLAIPTEVLFAPANEATALKPCPFCGNKDVSYEMYEHSAGTRYAVLCPKCMAGIDPGFAQDVYTVRRLWNRRTE